MPFSLGVGSKWSNQRWRNQLSRTTRSFAEHSRARKPGKVDWAFSFYAVSGILGFLRRMLYIYRKRRHTGKRTHHVLQYSHFAALSISHNLLTILQLFNSIRAITLIRTSNNEPKASSRHEGLFLSFCISVLSKASFTVKNETAKKEHGGRL